MKQEVLELWMEQGNSVNPFLLSISFFLFVFLVIKLNQPTKCLNLPPSPPKLPLIGNLHQLLHGVAHHTLSAFSQKYGPIMLLHLGRRPTLVISSADGAEDVFRTYNRVFSNRPLMLFRSQVFYDKCTLLAPYGKYWSQVRKVAVLQIFSAKKVQSFQFLREQEVSLMMETIKAASSSSSSLINLSQMFVALASNMIFRVAVGGKYNEEGRSFKDIFDEFVYLFGVTNVGDFIPTLAWLNHLNGLNARVKKNFKEIDTIIDHFVEERMENRRRGADAGNVEAAKEDDFMDVMLRTAEEDGTFGTQLGRENIKAAIMVMFAAGTHTSSSVMASVMSELMLHPEIMEEVQKEVRNIAKGKQTLRDTDIENMHYLKLVVKETLRMHPPTPLSVPRESMEKVTLQGYDIPANTMVVINLHAIGRDPKLWEEPEVFNPKRFSEGSFSGEVGFKGQHFQFTPFGGGRRGCPAIGFAMSKIELALANLLNSFNWELPNGMSIKDFDMQERMISFGGRKNDLILSAKLH